MQGDHNNVAAGRGDEDRYQLARTKVKQTANPRSLRQSEYEDLEKGSTAVTKHCTSDGV